MPDWEDVDVGGTIHIDVSGGTGTTSTSGSWGTFRDVHIRFESPGSRQTWGQYRAARDQARAQAPPVLWDATEAKRLFRLLSKRFHPDLNDEPIRIGKATAPPAEWMKLLNAVMVKRDMKTLRLLARSCPGSESG